MKILYPLKILLLTTLSLTTSTVSFEYSNFLAAFSDLSKPSMITRDDYDYVNKDLNKNKFKLPKQKQFSLESVQNNT